MTLTPMTLGRTIRRVARAEQVKAVHEGRIASAPDAKGRVYVVLRSLTGDNLRHGPFSGADAKVTMDGDDLVAVVPTRNDRCWVALDQGGDPACIVAWEQRVSA